MFIQSCSAIVAVAFLFILMGLTASSAKIQCKTNSVKCSDDSECCKPCKCKDVIIGGIVMAKTCESLGSVPCKGGWTAKFMRAVKGLCGKENSATGRRGTCWGQ